MWCPRRRCCRVCLSSLIAISTYSSQIVQTYFTTEMTGDCLVVCRERTDRKTILTDPAWQLVNIGHRWQQPLTSTRTSACIFFALFSNDTFPMVLMRRICLTINTFCTWSSFPLFSWPLCLIKRCYFKENFVFWSLLEVKGLKCFEPLSTTTVLQPELMEANIPTFCPTFVKRLDSHVGWCYIKIHPTKNYWSNLTPCWVM